MAETPEARCNHAGCLNPIGAAVGKIPLCYPHAVEALLHLLPREQRMHLLQMHYEPADREAAIREGRRQAFEEALDWAKEQIAIEGPSEEGLPGHQPCSDD
jgi:hypothetical protein